MRYETSIDVDAAPTAVWAVMRDVERWHEWTPSITSIHLADGGPLRPGSRARIRQPKLPPADWLVTELEEGRGFSWVSRGPGIRVTARHLVEPRSAGCRVTLSILYDGLLGPALGWLTRGINQRYLGLEAAGLKRRTEESARSPVPPR